jgi:hypothetical protein
MINKRFIGVAIAAALMSSNTAIATPMMVAPQIDMIPQKFGNKDRNTTSTNRVSQKKRRQRARRK